MDVIILWIMTFWHWPITFYSLPIKWNVFCRFACRRCICTQTRLVRHMLGKKLNCCCDRKIKVHLFVKSWYIINQTNEVEKSTFFVSCWSQFIFPDQYRCLQKIFTFSFYCLMKKLVFGCLYPKELRVIYGNTRYWKLYLGLY